MPLPGMVKDIGCASAVTAVIFLMPGFTSVWLITVASISDVSVDTVELKPELFSFDILVLVSSEDCFSWASPEIAASTLSLLAATGLFSGSILASTSAPTICGIFRPEPFLLI